MSSRANFFDKTIHYLFFVLFFFTPLILFPRTSEVFEFNKMLFVYVITSLVITSWFLKSVNNRKFTLNRTPIDIFILLFFLSQLLSTIYSIDPHTSLWGYYSRFHGGLASTICYVSLYYAFVSNFNPKSIKNLLQSTLISTILITTYAILEHFGIDKNIWVQDVQNRVFSTLGQPNWLSAYLIALLPITILLIPKHKWHIITALMIFISIIFTKSQSGIGATLIVLPITLIALVIRLRQTKLLWGVVPLIALVLIFNQKLLATSLHSLQNLNPFVSSVSLVNQDNNGRMAGSDSMTIRRLVWQGAIDLGRKYPILGTGVETFAYSYYWIRPAAHNLVSEWDFLYNKAHNEYLNFLATTGFVGLALYLALIISSLVLFIRSYKLVKDQENKDIILGLLLGYVSILITNFFGFSVVNVAILFFLFPAIAVLISHREKTINFTFNFDPFLGYCFAVPFIVYCLITINNFWQSDMLYNTGKIYRQSDLLQSMQYLEKAVVTNPQEPVFRSQLAEIEAQAALTVDQQLTKLATGSSDLTQGKAVRDQLIQKSIADSTKAVSMNPYHTNFLKSQSIVYQYLSYIDPQYNQGALDSLLKTAKLSPTDAKVSYYIGLTYDKLKNPTKAQEYYRLTLQLKPDYDEVKNHLAK